MAVFISLTTDAFATTFQNKADAQAAAQRAGVDRARRPLRGIEIKDEADMLRAGRRLSAMGCRNVLMKGGHLKGAPVDLLFGGEQATRFAGTRFAGTRFAVRCDRCRPVCPRHW